MGTVIGFTAGLLRQLTASLPVVPPPPGQVQQGQHNTICVLLVFTGSLILYFEGSYM